MSPVLEQESVGGEREVPEWGKGSDSGLRGAGLGGSRMGARRE